MKVSRNIFQMLAVLILSGLCAFAQTTGSAQKFDKDGLLFDYPAGWTVEDTSNSDAQRLSLIRANSAVQISVFVHRGRVLPEKMPDARKSLIDPYIDSTAKQFEQMGANPTKSAASTEISGVTSEGVKLSAVLSGEPGAAQIYWALIGERVVVLTFFGPDKQLKQFANAWDVIRNSLKIEGIKPAPK